MANDKFPTLNDAVAFLGWCENEVGRNDDVDDLLDGAIKSAAVMSFWDQQPIEKDCNTPPKKKKPRVRSAASSFTALQRRTKAEIQTLREQAVVLKGYVKQLKKRQGGLHKDFSLEFGNQSDGGLSSWHQRSIMEYQKRLQAEQTNKTLNDIYDRQLRVYSKLQTILKPLNVLRGQKFVEEVKPCEEISKDYSNLLFSQLENQVGELYDEFTANFQPQDPIQFCCTSQPHYDEKLKSPTVEFTTTTPLDCSNEDVCDGIWSSLQKNANSGSKANSLQGKVSLPLQHKKCVLHFEWFYYSEKYVEDDQTVIVWSDAVLLPSQKLEYRTHGYTVITPTTSGCSVRTKVKLYRERNEENVAEESTTMKQAHDIAFGALSIRVRRIWRTKQNGLVQRSLMITPSS